MVNLQELRARLADQNAKHREALLRDAREGFAHRKDVKWVLAVAASCDIAGLKMSHYDEGFRIVPGYGGWAVYIDLSVDGFLEAHDKRLSDLLASINASFPDREWASSDYPANKTRDYRIWSEGNSVAVNAKLKDDSPKCRRVVIGKKMEERDIFQFVCDGEEAQS